MIRTIVDIVLLVALALLFSRLFGYLIDKIKQPAVIGEILAGIFLGGISLYFFTGHHFKFYNMTFIIPKLNFTSEEFKILAEIGILFLLFISGLGTDLTKLKRMGKPSLFVAIGGIIVPFVLGVGAGFVIGFSYQESIIIGLILIATSVGVSIRTLMDMHVLDSDVGMTILGSAVIDDVLGIILLAFILGIESPLFIGIKIGLYFLIFLYLGLKVIDRVLDLGERIHLPKAFLSFTLAIFLFYTYFSYRAGIAGIIGAFVAGILIGQTIKSRKIIDDVETIGYGFFIPMFFVWVGANIWVGAESDFGVFVTILILSVLLIFVGVIGKVFGCGVGAKIAGFSSRESLQVGVGMVPRMELALIIASAAISHKMFGSALVGHQILSATILLTVISTILAPVLIKVAFKSS